MQPEILTMREISKRFGNTQALDRVDFSLRAGEVHALMGENGAGKSTLMKILIGLYTADSGNTILDGRTVAFQSPREALASGIAMIHQELYPVPDMTVADNVFLGREIRGAGFGLLRLVNNREIRRQTRLSLQDMGLDVDPAEPMRNLSVAEAQMVEIIKAVSQGAKVIIMDEPTSAITEKETERLFAQIAKLKASGVAIVYISHKMGEIFRISDRITVLRDGCFIDSRPAGDYTPELLVKQMVGREIQDIYPHRKSTPGEVALEIRNLADAGKFEGVSFTLRKGEILGMAGLMGAGRTEVAECIFGLNPRASGEIRINGELKHIKSPLDAIANGMALISDDRKLKGLNLKATVGNNVSLVHLRAFSRFGVVARRPERESVRMYMDKFSVKAESPDSLVTSLSGGNQQKVVLAKWLMAEPEILIFDEPTRGIDVGAKHEIYMLMTELAARGKAILMISSEMGEIVGMSDRVVVLADGKLTGELEKEKVTQEAIMALASNLPA